MKKIIIGCISLFLTIATGNSQSVETLIGNQITITVAKNGSGNYTTVSEAISAVPDNSSQKTVLYIKNGTYTEKVEIPPSKKNLTIIGEDALNTVISYNDYSGSGKIYNGILTWANGNPTGTATSHSMYVGADDVSIMNLTIENTAGDVGQAVALNSECDKFLLYHCRLIGYQDTYYTRGGGRFYIKDCYIEGAVDYIFGTGVAYFEDCQIHSIRSGAYITAAATTQGFLYGYVFKNCKLTAGSGYSSIYLGRPWKSYAKTVFINCDEGKFLNAAGWHEWSSAPENSGTCFYAEYDNCGEGSNISGRVSWSHQLSNNEASKYTMHTIFGTTVNPTPYASNWNPNIQADIFVQAVQSITNPFISNTCYSIEPACEASISANGPVQFFYGQTVNLSASEGIWFQWMKDGTAILGEISQTLTADQSGTYSVSVSNESGCLALSNSIVVAVEPIPIDCNGDAFGEAFTDMCGQCVGGHTGIEACIVQKLQAEDLCLLNSAFEEKNQGFEGRGYINSDNQAGVNETIHLYTEKATSVRFGIVYANGSSNDRNCSIMINHFPVAPNVSMPSTGTWEQWEHAVLSIDLQAGINTVFIEATTEEGLANIDYFTLNGNGYFALCDTLSIVLKKGWNLISSNVYTNKKSVEQFFAGAKIKEVKNNECFWSANNPAFCNSLHSINYGSGYYVYTNDDFKLSVEGFSFPNYNEPYALNTGWNLVGCPYASSILIDTMQKVSAVKNFEDFWQLDSTTNSLNTIDPGMGYYIFK